MHVSAALASAALLTACASSKSGSDSNGTTTTSSGTSATSSGRSGSSSSGSSAASPSGSGSTSSPSVSAYFPVKLGNTWLYRTNYGNASLGVVMETERITSVQTVAEGQRVTIKRTFHYVNGRVGDFTSTAIYVYHPDGSLTVPYQSGLVNQTVVVKSGSIVWPSPSQLETGTPRTGKVQLAIQTGGRSVDASLFFTVQGVGTATITVPAGTYRTRVLDETLQESVSSVETPLGIHSEMWTATGVGLVKSTSNASALTGGSTITTVLMKFTAG
jgi:hypothetical protein